MSNAATAAASTPMVSECPECGARALFSDADGEPRGCARCGSLGLCDGCGGEATARDGEYVVCGDCLVAAIESRARRLVSEVRS